MDNPLRNWDYAGISSLCRELNMPAGAEGAMMDALKGVDAAKLLEEKDALRDYETGEAATRRVQDALSAVDSLKRGYIELGLSLEAALDTRAGYREAGIPDEIFLATMGCFSRFVREHRESFGRYGFDRFFWTFRQLSRGIYRIGELEFDLHCGHENALGIHIPSDARLASCRESCRRALDFMKRFHPDFCFDRFHCHSWLLSPELKKLLDPSSHILAFQSDFTLEDVDLDSEGYKLWLFKRGGLALQDAPENTSLQRRAKAHLLSGGKIGEAAGYIPLERILS